MNNKETSIALFGTTLLMLEHYCKTEDERFLMGALYVIDGALGYLTTGEKQELPISELLDEIGMGEQEFLQ